MSSISFFSRSRAAFFRWMAWSLAKSTAARDFSITTALFAAVIASSDSYFFIKPRIAWFSCSRASSCSIRCLCLPAICSLIVFRSSTRFVCLNFDSSSLCLMSLRRSISMTTSMRESNSFSIAARRSFSSSCWSRMVNAIARCAMEFSSFTTSEFESSFFSAWERMAFFLAASATSTSDFLASSCDRFSSTFMRSLRSLESLSFSSFILSAYSLSAWISASDLITEPYLMRISSSAEITTDDGPRGPVTFLLVVVRLPPPFPNRDSSIDEVEPIAL
mmetsp:Transcript_10817/g.23960  ORF Transcript_10817/g.23960 Transcript_10817/m.23960 type:complete len:276 (-) Transcript_10817:134-961(-)